MSFSLINCYRNSSSKQILQSVCHNTIYSIAVGMWGVRMVGVIVFGFLLNLDIAGVWLSIGIDLCVFLIYDLGVMFLN